MMYAQTSTRLLSGRLFVILTVGLAVAVTLSVLFATDAEAKKKKKRTSAHPALAGTTLQPPPTYFGEDIARYWGSNAICGTDGTTSNAPVQVSNLSGVKDIADGVCIGLALKTDGTVWAWSNNDHGQLGNGTTTPSSTPVQVSNLSGVKAIAVGEEHGLALKTDGTVWAWGYNNHGQLGDGSTTDRYVPVQVSNLSGVKAVAAGRYHSIALKEDGTVWVWGWNASGQLGDGSTTDRYMPVQVKGQPLTNKLSTSSLIIPPVAGNYLSGVKAIAGGESHSLALKEDGTVWAWGSNDRAQLGNGIIAKSNTPVRVSNLSGVKAVAGGDNHNLALEEDGTVWAWGYNVSGQLGNGTNTTKSNTPVQVSNLGGVKALAAGGLHSLALKTDGTVWAWGDNEFGQLGIGTYSPGTNTPVEVSNLGNASAIAAGGQGSLAKVSNPPVLTQ